MYHLIFITLLFAMGTIGSKFPIPMSEPYCMTACDSALALRLSCSEMSMDEGEMSYESSTDCSGSNIPFMSSLAWCGYINCQEKEKVPAEDIEQYWYSQNISLKYNYEGALALAKRPVEIVDYNATWLNDTMLVNPTSYAENYETDKYFSYQEYTHARMALSLIMITWILVISAFIFKLFQTYEMKWIPKKLKLFLRKYIFYPALFSERCNRALPYNIGYLPPRIVSITIFLYIVINILFCAVPYKSVKSLWYATSTDELLAYVGNRTGVLAFANLPILILFAGRNNLFSFLTGWSQMTFQHYHRWVSYTAIAEAIAHSIIYTNKYLRAGEYAAEAKKAYYWWGILATVAISIIPGFAILAIRKATYEVFWFIHVILGILTLIGCWYHVYLRFSNKWGYEYWLYLSFAIWGCDRLVRLVRLIRYILMPSSLHSKIELISEDDDDNPILKLTASTNDSGQRFCCNYYFLYFPTIFPFVSSHPFTVTFWNFPKYVSEKESKGSSESSLVQGSIENKITFLIKPRNGITKILYRKVLNSTLRTPSGKRFIEIPTLLEGPYGEYELFPFENFQSTVVLCGGIGSTSGLNIINSYIQQYPFGKGPRLQVLFTSRSETELNLYKEYLQFLDDHDYNVSVTFHNSISGRINIKQFMDKEILSIPGKYQRYSVVCCGPDKFNDDCRRIVVGYQSFVSEDTYIDFYPFAFSW